MVAKQSKSAIKRKKTRVISPKLTRKNPVKSWMAIPLVALVALAGYAVVSFSHASSVTPMQTIVTCDTSSTKWDDRTTNNNTPVRTGTRTASPASQSKQNGTAASQPSSDPLPPQNKCKQVTQPAPMATYDISALPTNATDLCVSGSQTGNGKIVLLAQTGAQSEEKLPQGVANGRSNGFPLCISMKELHRYLNEKPGTHNVYGINTTVIAYPSVSGVASGIPLKDGSASFGAAYWHCGVVDTGHARPGYEPCDPKKPVLPGVVTNYNSNPPPDDAGQ